MAGLLEQIEAKTEGAVRTFNRGLRFRVLLLLGLIFGIVLAVASYRSYERRNADLLAAKTRLAWHVQSISEKQGEVVNDIQRFIALLLGSYDIASFSREVRCKQLFAYFLHQDTRIANMLIADANGNVLCNATATQQPINISDRAYFQQALASHGMVIEEAIVSRSTGKWSLPLAQAIRDDEGKVQAVLGVGLDLNWVKGEFGKADYPENARLGLVDSKGMVLVRYPDPGQLVGRNISSFPGFKALITQGGSGIVESDSHDQVTRIFAFARFAETPAGPIYLWIGLPKKDVVARAENQYAWAMTIALILIVASFTAAWYGSERLLIRPIAMLVEAAQRLSRGDFRVRTGLPHGDDELGRLAHAFDEMAQALSSRSQSLRLNRTLMVLSACNKAVIHAESEEKLLSEICRMLVDVGGYRMVWIGMAEHDAERKVRPVAQHGYEDRYLSAAEISWGDTERGQGPTGTAIRTGLPQYNQDFESSAGTAPWRAEALRNGYRSSCALPLKDKGEVLGALTIYSEWRDAFNADETKLLEELAENLAFGIRTLRLKVGAR